MSSANDTPRRHVVDTAYYDLFGLTPDATSSQIKKAYHKRALLCHPDKHPGDAAKEQEFKELSEAYQTLFDEERRAVYDALGRDGLQGNVHCDPRQVFAALFGGPEFEPWVGQLGGQVDDELHAPLKAAQQRTSENHARLIGLIRAQAPADEIAACREVQKSLQEVEDSALKAAREGAAEAHRKNVAACVQHLEARIAPYVAAALAGDEIDAAARALAKETFETSVAAERDRLKRCSMGEPMLHALGYAYVRQTLKVRGKREKGAARLGGLYESALHGVHNVRDGVSAVGSAVGMASDAWKLARDSRPETPAEKRLSDAQRADLEERVKQRTMDLAWAMTKRSIEGTARAVVDQILGRAFAYTAPPPSARPGAAGGEDPVAASAVGAPLACDGDDGDDGVELVHGLSEAELRARGDALILLGGAFSGEKPHEAVDRAVEKVDLAVSRLTTSASEATTRAKSFFGGLMASARERQRGTNAQTETIVDVSAQPQGTSAAGSTSSASDPAVARRWKDPAVAPPPTESVGAFFREVLKR